MEHSGVGVVRGDPRRSQLHMIPDGCRRHHRPDHRVGRKSEKVVLLDADELVRRQTRQR